MHGLAISDAITSLLLHLNEPNKVDPERTKKDEEVWRICAAGQSAQLSSLIHLEMTTASR
jgi:hypothetical protein